MPSPSCMTMNVLQSLSIQPPSPVYLFHLFQLVAGSMLRWLWQLLFNRNFQKRSEKCKRLTVEQEGIVPTGNSVGGETTVHVNSLGKEAFPLAAEDTLTTWTGLD